MRSLLDENLDPRLAQVLSIVADEDGFVALAVAGQTGMDDEDIPALCARERIDALITANYKDFGAKKMYYQALMEEGVSVIVIRPGKIAFDSLQQSTILTRWWKRIRTLLAEAQGAAVLIHVTQTDVRLRNLESLIAEFGEQ